VAALSVTAGFDEDSRLSLFSASVKAPQTAIVAAAITNASQPGIDEPPDDNNPERQTRTQNTAKAITGKPSSITDVDTVPLRPTNREPMGTLPAVYGPSNLSCRDAKRESTNKG
jgi:hypothetical protein